MSYLSTDTNIISDHTAKRQFKKTSLIIFFKLDPSGRLAWEINKIRSAGVIIVVIKIIKSLKID
jgi:hypothetical protein